MKAVMVTGATTPLGQRLVRALLGDDERPMVLAVGREPHPRQLPLEHPRLRYRAVDLTRDRSIRRLLFGDAAELGVEVIIHGALHRSAHDTGKRIHRLNVDTTRALMHLAERHPTVRRFVYRSYAEIYRIEHDQPTLLGEDHPLDFGPRSPQRVRDRIEADLIACTRLGQSPLHIVVLRFAEILAPDEGSQLWDYLRPRVCFRPWGFDPMINLLSVEDAVRATILAMRTEHQGIFNIAGRDTLPLSRVIARAGRTGVPVVGPMMRPLYALRRHTVGGEFRYDMNQRRFHFSGILDGCRAERELGYVPTIPVEWPTAPASTSAAAS